MRKIWLNRVFRLKNKYREREGYFEVVLHNPDTKEEVVSLIDKEDFLLVNNYTWRLTKNGYAYNRVKGYLHRYLMNPSTKFDVDHISRDRLDNRRSNLRICTRSQNNMNKDKNKNNSSGVKGVYLCKSTGRWATEIMKDRKKIWLGRYNTFEEAVKVRREAELKYYGEFRPEA